MSSLPSNSGSDPSGARPLRGLLPPGARPLSDELIADLHARREWLAEASATRSWKRVHEYLGREWYDREARRWAAADIQVDAALLWRELGLLPSEAAELQREGFVPEEVNSRWRGSGMPAEEMADWIGAGLTPEEALSQRAQGVTAEDAAVMRRLRSLGAD